MYVPVLLNFSEASFGSDGELSCCAGDKERFFVKVPVRLILVGLGMPISSSEGSKSICSDSGFSCCVGDKEERFFVKVPVLLILVGLGLPVFSSAGSKSVVAVTCISGVVRCALGTITNPSSEILSKAVEGF